MAVGTGQIAAVKRLLTAGADQTLMDDDGETKEDLKLPSGTDDLNKLQEELKKAFDDGKDMIIVVLSSMNEEMIVAARESQNN